MTFERNIHRIEENLRAPLPHLTISHVAERLALDSLLSSDRMTRSLLAFGWWLDFGPSWAERERIEVERRRVRHYPARARRWIRLRVNSIRYRVRHVIDAALDRPCEYAGEDY